MEASRVDRESKKKAFFHAKGVTYFDKRMERSFFFFVTILMLAWGLIEKFVL
jgi:hypothetical protein